MPTTATRSLALALPLALTVTFSPALAGCHGGGDKDETVLELKTYEVPKGMARPLVRTVEGVLWTEEKKNIGRATVTPDGKLAVLAPRNMQTSIERLVEDAGKHAPTVDQTIAIHYFLLVGKPSTSPGKVPEGLGEIAPALEEIQRAAGPQTFTLGKRVVLTSLNDEQGRLNGDELEVYQTAVGTADGVYANVTIRYGKTDKLETRVRLAPDKIVVLGATGLAAGDGNDGSTLYYVVRLAPRADGSRP